MEIAELESIFKSITPDDVIAVVLMLLPEDEFIADDATIHATVTELADEYPTLFGSFEITADHPYPFSRPLEMTLDRLSETRWLGTWNPDFTVYRVDSDSKKAIEKTVWPLFTPEQQDMLRVAAEKLAKALKLHCQQQE